MSFKLSKENLKTWSEVKKGVPYISEVLGQATGDKYSKQTVMMIALQRLEHLFYEEKMNKPEFFSMERKQPWEDLKQPSHTHEPGSSQ